VNRIALKMLFGDKAKFLTLIVALTFTAFLLLQQGSVFCGLMLRTAQNVFETGAPIWVIDKTANSFNDVVDLKLSEVARVRSVSGVDWAVPMSLHGAIAQSDDGKTAAVQVVGVDDESLIGLPPGLTQGSYFGLNEPNGVIISKTRSERYGSPEVGDEFEINDNRVKVVGILDSKKTFAPFPIMYTAISRVQRLLPDKQRIVSFILVKPKAGEDSTALCHAITDSTGLKAVQLWGFVWSTMKFWAENTGIPVTFGISVLMVLIIGTVITAQTLYAFMLENIRQFGTFKAIGIRTRQLVSMILLQSITVGLIGFGIGSGVAAMVGLLNPPTSPLAFYTPWQVVVIVFILVMSFCFLGSLLSLNRVLRIDPAIVFRG
jgi:putative ABC transport system permease protein